MALAPCRECGGQVSTEAAACPHCGVPDPSREEEVTAQETPSGGSWDSRKIILAVLAIFGAAFLASQTFYSTDAGTDALERIEPPGAGRAIYWVGRGNWVCRSRSSLTTLDQLIADHDEAARDRLFRTGACRWIEKETPLYASVSDVEQSRSLDSDDDYVRVRFAGDISDSWTYGGSFWLRDSPRATRLGDQPP